MAHLEYHFDIVCPYAYLGSTQIEALCERTEATLSWHPVLLGGILKSIGSDPMFTLKLPAAKIRHNLLDMLRWADVWEVPFSMHQQHPVRTVMTQRAIIAAGAHPKLIHRLYRAYWVENLDLNNAGLLAEIITDAGFDGPAVVEQTNNPQIKQALRKATDEVTARGAFGVPAMFVDETLIWGQDRLSFVEQLLTKELQ
ncbi:MAG TPA: 2-hydroxychromene-2-carboxylate isomerase [Myxococcales bacterium]|nr:2-hydroxychromene-2-carboxylate isomerase [Myxococcales bacterium]